MIAEYLFDRNRQYTENELIDMIVNLEVRQWTILITQKNLSGDFCSKYLFEEKYSITDADEYIDVYDVIKYQPHLKEYFFPKGYKIVD